MWASASAGVGGLDMGPACLRPYDSSRPERDNCATRAHQCRRSGVPQVGYGWLLPVRLALCAAVFLALTPASASAFQFLGKWGSFGAGTGQLNQPYDLAVNPDTGDQYIADHDNNRIVEFNAA